MTQTPREPWRRRRSARLHDTEPRMDMRVTGEKMHPPPDVLRGETVHDRTCLGCGCHVCGCEQKFADEMARAECDVLAQRWVCVDCSGHLADYGTTIAGVAEAVMAHACEPKTYGRIDSVTIAGVEHDTIGGAVFLPKFRHYTVHDPADPPDTHVDTDGSEYARTPAHALPVVTVMWGVGRINGFSVKGYWPDDREKTAYLFWVSDVIRAEMEGMPSTDLSRQSARGKAHSMARQAYAKGWLAEDCRGGWRWKRDAVEPGHG